jgi:predicted nucleotidyltransferase
MIEKTVGVPSVLQRALAGAEESIHLAVLYGSVPRGSDSAQSDIDILLVSDSLVLEEAFRLLATAERALGRVVSPTLLTMAEFQRPKRRPFWSKVLSGKHVVLMGTIPTTTAT